MHFALVYAAGRFERIEGRNEDSRGNMQRCWSAARPLSAHLRRHCTGTCLCARACVTRTRLKPLPLYAAGRFERIEGRNAGSRGNRQRCWSAARPLSAHLRRHCTGTCPPRFNSSPPASSPALHTPARNAAASWPATHTQRNDAHPQADVGTNAHSHATPASVVCSHMQRPLHPTCLPMRRWLQLKGGTSTLALSSPSPSPSPPAERPWTTCRLRQRGRIGTRCTKASGRLVRRKPSGARFVVVAHASETGFH
jgi:hypothetical protein